MTTLVFSPLLVVLQLPLHLLLLLLLHLPTTLMGSSNTTCAYKSVQNISLVSQYFKFIYFSAKTF